MSDIASTNTADCSDIFEILEKKNVLTPQQVDIARRRMLRAKVPAYMALIELEYCSQEIIYRALSEATGMPFLILYEVEISDDVKKSVPAKAALHYKFVPFAIKEGALHVAFANPPGIRDLENLRLLLGRRIIPFLATNHEVNMTLKSIYGLGVETVIKIQERQAHKKTPVKEVHFQGAGNLQEDDESAPIINLVNQILVDALEMNTTDIHIEPFYDTVKLRYRIDGMLQDIPVPNGIRRFHEAIISRMKIMANLNIAERRLPHDGRIRVSAGNEEFDLRVSIIPTRFGETICLRILNREAIFLDMSDLGLGTHELNILNQLINLPHGIVLVTGPTGSGKTTTLYAALDKLKINSPERKIITVEDPVEYEMQGITQIQMHSEIGLTFASGLRSILRHDPDIILVGEIRDGETADIAIRASLTGHLVFSTLHTNDSVGSVNRLIDMGIEPYLTASSLVACLAQRLVRRICKHCKEPFEEIPDPIRKEVAETLNIKEEEVKAWKGKGCVECNHTGYRGRVAIYEFFLLDAEIQDMVSAHAASSELRAKAKEKGMKTLRMDGWSKLAQGLTTIDEVSRITGNFLIGYDMGDTE